MSHEKKRSACGDTIEERPGTPTSQALRAVRQFKGAHESFRLRMFQEQHGFEPVVFMTKKRTRDNKSVMSEFKGGDLNKYTAKTYAIQNGNEVFGASRVLSSGTLFDGDSNFGEVTSLIVLLFFAVSILDLLL
uniref:Tub domain-containing protein n=1 Tax=Heterorhabditis bacteriophora TaxID=37862 RepID=A0A1I7X3T5_HETBA